MEPMNMDMSTYYHEAAHAVFAWSVNMTINEVQVRVASAAYMGDDNTDGYVSVMLPVGDEYVNLRVGLALAGMYGESMVLGRNVRKGLYSRIAATGDLAAAKSEAGSKWANYISMMREHMDKYVSQVKTLAQYLVQHPTMSGDEVMQVLGVPPAL